MSTQITEVIWVIAHITFDYFASFFVSVLITYGSLEDLFEDVEPWTIIGIRFLSTISLYCTNVILWFDYRWQQDAATFICIALVNHFSQSLWFVLYVKCRAHRTKLVFSMTLLLVLSAYFASQLYVLSVFATVMAVLDTVLLIISVLTVANTLSDELKNAQHDNIFSLQPNLQQQTHKLTHRNPSTTITAANV